ncbi:MAG TPA: hypothetical protein VF071_07355, partial [Candidatus Limnocylindria bacterium]
MARGFDQRRQAVQSAAAALMVLLVACSTGEPSPSAALTPVPPTAGTVASASPPEGVVAVSLNEMDLVLSSGVAPAGEVTFQIKNSGELPHELVVIRTETDADELPVEEVKVVERGLEIVARSEHIPAAQEATLTVDLTPGHYVLICNLSGHYEE